MIGAELGRQRLKSAAGFAVLFVASAASFVAGCSVAASGQLSRVVYDADNAAG